MDPPQITTTGISHGGTSDGSSEHHIKNVVEYFLREYFNRLFFTKYALCQIPKNLNFVMFFKSVIITNIKDKLN